MTSRKNCRILSAALMISTAAFLLSLYDLCTSLKSRER